MITAGCSDQRAPETETANELKRLSCCLGPGSFRRADRLGGKENEMPDTVGLNELERRIALVDRAHACELEGPYPADPITNGGCNWLVGIRPAPGHELSEMDVVDQQVDMLQQALPRVQWPAAQTA
jgi:hypothetical protein